MSSRGEAKKLGKPVKPASQAKPAARLAKEKPAAKKELAKVTRFPSRDGEAKAAPASAPAEKTAAARKPESPPQHYPASAPPHHSATPPPHPHAAPARTTRSAAKKSPGSTTRSGALQTTLAKQSLARSFYWSELRVGDDLPPLGKPQIDRVQIARYAAAANDFNRLHLDEPFAHALGFPGTFAPGALAMGFVGQLLTAWLRRGHVRRLSARFVKIVWPGDELTCHGRIAELRKESGACYADVELWAENKKGELVLRGQATCELYESPGAGSAEGSGLLFSLDRGRPAPPAQRSSGGSRPVSSASVPVTPALPKPPAGHKKK